MTPLRAQMIYQMQLERLAPKTQAAYVAAVAGLATFYHCSPDQLRPDQLRHYLHHLLVDRHRSWSSCNQVACGLRFFYTKTLEGVAVSTPPAAHGAVAAPPGAARRGTPAPVHECQEPQKPGPPDDDLCRWPARQCSRPSEAHGH
jgi:Phage integrase, N-terminal SAM-like domain